MSRNDLDYYQRREQQERKLANNADDSAARRAHLVMAEHFGDMFRRAGGQPLA